MTSPLSHLELLNGSNQVLSFEFTEKVGLKPRPSRFVSGLSTLERYLNESRLQLIRNTVGRNALAVVKLSQNYPTTITLDSKQRLGR